MIIFHFIKISISADRRINKWESYFAIPYTVLNTFITSMISIMALDVLKIGKCRGITYEAR